MISGDQRLQIQDPWHPVRGGHLRRSGAGTAVMLYLACTGDQEIGGSHE
jgi:hypothetical protein